MIFIIIELARVHPLVDVLTNKARGILLPRKKDACQIKKQQYKEKFIKPIKHARSTCSFCSLKAKFNSKRTFYVLKKGICWHRERI